MKFNVVSFFVLVAQLGVSAGCGHSRVMAIGGTVVDGAGNVVVGNTVPFTDHRRAVALASPVAVGVVLVADLTVPQVTAVGLSAPVVEAAPGTLGERPDYCWEREDLLVVSDSQRVRLCRFAVMFYVHLRSIVVLDEDRVVSLAQLQND